MKKYRKFWTVLILGLIIFINYFYTRPRTISDIIMTSPDFADVLITEWARLTPSHKTVELTPKEFHNIVDMMNANKYSRTWIKEAHRSDSDSYYFITFECYLNKTHEKQTITLAQNGSITIDNGKYKVSNGIVTGEEMVQNVYEYISEIVEESLS